MPTTPADVIAGTLRRRGDADDEVTAKRIITDLEGNGWRIVRDTRKTITYCPHHPSVKMPCQMPHPRTAAAASR